MLESGSRGRRDRHPGDPAAAGSASHEAIAFDMGGTTAKAGVIYEGKPLTTGSALLGGYEQALPIQIPMTDIHEVGPGGGSIARLDAGQRAARRAAQRRLDAGARLLRPRRHRADGDRRQPACSGVSIPTISSAAR